MLFLRLLPRRHLYSIDSALAGKLKTGWICFSGLKVPQQGAPGKGREAFRAGSGKGKGRSGFTLLIRRIALCGARVQRTVPGGQEPCLPRVTAKRGGTSQTRTQTLGEQISKVPGKDCGRG